MLSVAAAYSQNGRPTDGIQTLVSSELVDQAEPAAIALLMRLFAEAQRYDELQQTIPYVGEQVKRYPDYWMAIGSLANHQSDDAAISFFATAIRKEPDSLEAHRSLAHSLLLHDRPVAAGYFRERAELLNRCQTSVRVIRSLPSPDPKLPFAVAELLNEAGHLLESLAWQELAVAHFSPGSNKLKTLQQYKSKVVLKIPSGYDDGKLFPTS